MDFLQKRWVRALGYIVMTIYSLLGILLVRKLINETVFRPPELVFYPGDVIGWMGYMFFLFIIFISGILAIVTAYKMRGVFRFLYIMGILAIFYSISFIELSIHYNVSVEFNPDIADQQFLVDKWINDYQELELFSDSTYILLFDNKFLFWGDITKYEGTWKLDRNEIHMSDINPNWRYPWEVRMSEGYYFITYKIHDNPDAWSGDLGLMRESEWLDTH